MRKFNIFLIALIALTINSCATSNIFAPIGTNIAAPNGIVIDSANNKLYLINSNSTVLYRWEEGSIQILDITNPLSPVLENTVQTVSFSGQAILDQTRNLLYTSNRYSENSATMDDQLLVMNTDANSADFLTVTDSATSKDPYGLACCYPADRMWIANEDNVLEYKDLGPLTSGTIDLLQPLSNGSSLASAEASFIALNGSQAYLPRIRDGLMVVNLDEAGDTTKNALDYLITDINDPQGIVVVQTPNGTRVGVVSEDNIDGNWTPIFYVLDLTSLTPLTDNTETTVLDKDEDALLVATIVVGKQPETAFATTNYVFVSSKEEDLITVLDINNDFAKIKDIAVGEEPFGMALYAPGGNEQYVYVGNVISNTLSIIDLNTLEVVATYP
ncbi:MAG: hypothetical protein ABH859_07730 [Pseudomonadota bacterium]